MAREGKIFISVDLIKTGVNRWGRWREVQQETAHLSGFSNFSFNPYLFPSHLFPLLFFLFFFYNINSWPPECPNSNFHSGNVTDDKKEGKKIELTLGNS